MKEIEWTDDLSVGVGLIDEQHKMLIKRLNDLKLSLTEQQGPAQIASTMNFLVEYTDFHFSTEEKHMEANEYPTFEAHKKMHDGFKQTLSGLEEDFEEEGATQGLADSIDTLLVNWLINHIQKVDVEFGKFLMSKGIELPEEG
ncbi:MAG: hemerythrin [Desulfobacteraceae bacterium]|nr:MAG: hemerythrin [Desulfobacteraceae bacterium]